MRKVFLAIILIFTVIMLGCGLNIKGIKWVKIGERTMRAYIKGSGDKTIVMLSGWSTDSPLDDFMPLADKLSQDYRVVVLEYFGYGLSDITTDERSNKIMVQEIRTTLSELKVRPPYILMPHSMSGLYSLHYAENYPDEVSGIVGIDMSLPQKQLERWTEETFEKISEESSDLNISVINQWNSFYNNSKELENMKYSSNLPVLAYLATEQIDHVNLMIKSGIMRTSWFDINKNMITNSDIQAIEILEGEHYLHHDRLEEIYESTKEFVEGKLS